MQEESLLKVLETEPESDLFKHGIWEADPTEWNPTKDKISRIHKDAKKVKVAVFDQGGKPIGRKRSRKRSRRGAGRGAGRVTKECREEEEE
jgi:hypothetical protein